jgi:hypothetical protein
MEHTLILFSLWADFWFRLYISSAPEDLPFSKKLAPTSEGLPGNIKSEFATGEPCNTVLRRSYGLTKYEDTIHNKRRQNMRYRLCIEEKTFIEKDTFMRHMRVVHPDVDFQAA